MIPTGRLTRHATNVIRQGGVVAYPTESCFGLGCDPRSRRAVHSLLRLKRRPQKKGLILIAHEARQFQRLARVPAACEAQWPAPITWLVPTGPAAKAWITGKHPRIAVRVPDHAIARALAKAAGMALVSTSANRTGQRPARSAREIRRRFGARIGAVVDGRIGGRRAPSTIRDAISGQTLRGNP